VLAAYAALRASEIAALTVENIDRRNRVMYVLQAKGQKDRAVAISAALNDELVRYGPPRRGPLIATLAGQHYKPGSLSSLVCAYFKTIGVQSSLHPGRHWAASMAYTGTGDIRAVQELLGHASLNQAVLYTKISGVETRAAVEAIPRVS
jgi:integrase